MLAPRWKLLACAGLLIAAGCDSDAVTGPQLDDTSVVDLAAQRADAADEGRIGFMNWNVFIGAAIEDALGVPPELVQYAAGESFARVLANDFASRAAALGEEAARFGPHLIGFQEVTLFELFDGAEFVPILDYEAMLLAALGPDYAVAAKSQNFQTPIMPVTLPSVPCAGDQNCAPPPDCAFIGECMLIRLTDYDLVVARTDVATENPQAHRFTYNLGEGPFADPSIPFPIYRGWASVDATIDGLKLRFASTHLEPADRADGSIVPGLEQLQRLQAGELAATIGVDLPVVSVGDYNTDAYGASTATYEDLLAYEFEDAWSQSGGGMTCCQTEDLSIRQSIRDRRVDLIMLRGDFGLLEPGIQGAVSTRVLGSRIADLTDTGLWPSDHAGVLATMKLPRRN
ncbi:MAG: hypothetical protein JJE01_10820 [Gemmatimonadetes bacterium]|nr:hypothetical protein [Gemmatimonadota bacterium]